MSPVKPRPMVGHCRRCERIVEKTIPISAYDGTNHTRQVRCCQCGVPVTCRPKRSGEIASEMGAI